MGRPEGRLNEAFHGHVQLAPCELNATDHRPSLHLWFPSVAFFQHGGARVRERTEPHPQGAHRLWENADYAWVNHQAEKGVTTVVQTRCLLKGGKTEKCDWAEAARERQEYLGPWLQKVSLAAASEPLAAPLTLRGEQAEFARDEADTDTSPARTRQFWERLRSCSPAHTINLAQINA